MIISGGFFKDEVWGVYFTIPFPALTCEQISNMTEFSINKLKGEYKSALDVAILSMINKDYIILSKDYGYLQLSQPVLGEVNCIVFIYTFIKNKPKAEITHELFMSAIHDIGIVSEGLNKDDICIHHDIIENAEDNSITCILFSNKNKFFRDEMVLNGYKKIDFKNFMIF